MDKNRAVSFEYTLNEEGGNFREDRPFRTKWGFTLNDLFSFGYSTATKDHFETLAREEAKDLYNRVWDKASLDQYASGLDYLVFDTGIYCGFDTVTRWLNTALSYDHWTPGELGKLTVKETTLLIDKLVFLRRRRHKTEPGWVNYQSVRTNRVNRVQRRARHLIGQSLEVAVT